MTANEQKSVVAFLAFAYCVMLAYSYVRYIQPNYEYMGFLLNSRPAYIEFFVFIFFASLISIFLPGQIRKPSDVFVYFSYFIVYLPSVSVSYFSLLSPGEPYVWLLLTFTLCILVALLGVRLSIKLPELVDMRERRFWVAIGVLVAVLCIPVFYYYKINLNIVSQLQEISSLYDIREEYRATNASIPAVAQYAFAWLIKVVAPLVLILGLCRKNLTLVASSVFLIFILFTVSGHKSIFLSLFLILGFWGAFSTDKGVTAYRAAFAFAFVCLFGLLLSYFNFHVVTEILVRRMMVVPGLLSGYYFEYYNSGNYTFLGHSILASVAGYGEQPSPPFLIGAHYFGRATMSANVNYIASAYADFGVLGGLFFTALAVFLFRVFDVAAARKESQKILCLAVLMPTWAMVDSALLTVMLTHGLLLLLAILCFFPKRI